MFCSHLGGTRQKHGLWGRADRTLESLLGPATGWPRDLRGVTRSLRAPVSSLRNEDNELVFVERFEICGWSVRGVSDLSELGRTAAVSLGCKAREKKACL